MIMYEVKWSNEETFKFIELYQNEPAIWNPNNKNHKDKNAVNDAWKRIADAIFIPVSELKKKKETLLAAFRLNHKKVLASLRSRAGEEEIYKPIWIYYDVLAAFLSNVYECRSILTTKDEDFLENKELTPDQNLVKANQSVQPPIEISTPKRRCHKSKELDDTRAQINPALNIHNNALSNTKQNNEHEDDCDLYGRLLATKLRLFSEIDRQELICEIDGLILKQQRKCFDHQSILSRPSTSRTMFNSYSRFSFTCSNCSTPFTSPAQSKDCINSSPQVIICPSPLMNISQSQQFPQETNHET